MYSHFDRQPPHRILNDFLSHWAQPLLDILRVHETDQCVNQPCYSCKGPVALYCCEECQNPPMQCESCIVAHHVHSPFHRILRWSGNHFRRTTLDELGLLHHLGHHGEPCPSVNALLKQFQNFSTTAQVSAHHFYAMIKKQTNNAFATDVKDRYRELMMAEHQYSYIRALKRNNLDVAKQLPLDSLTVLCPACPQPGINMDLNWRDRPSSER
ncbi:hypothetical protein JAAARDRAFT_142578 [Jaapia argillacea MUCL 33604]|uniref:CxC2-like cysteine cluster KDZ transposase-associated domain-containing protein n=1 Tax=Jaapia argillacea MUCL 33604 TaxID=933084 RepID=A0A067PG89_9AGAM|nr:hypothetical protein JAAARDRAFT_142578 [Jaapia argillacea MUCL 33604]